MSDYIAPVMYVDPSGESFLLIGGAILLGGLIGGLVGVFTATDDENLWGAFAGGFVNGGINTAGLAAALATGGAGAILWAGGLGFVGGFLGNTTSQLISYDDYDPTIAILNGGISGASNLVAYWGASTFITPGTRQFQDTIIPSLGMFAIESYLRPYIPNPNKLLTMSYTLNTDMQRNQLVIDLLWR